jgi:hypothetical protein
MALQVIKDGQGGNIGIFVPMNDWNTITQKYEGLKELVDVTAGVDAFLPVWQIQKIMFREITNLLIALRELVGYWAPYQFVHLGQHR